MNPLAMAQQMLRNNPKVMNDPTKREMVNALLNNDQVNGQRIAMNLCQTYGMTPQQMLNKAGIKSNNL